MKINHQPFVTRAEYKSVCAERDEFKVMYGKLMQRVRDYEDEADLRRWLAYLVCGVVSLLASSVGVLLGHYFFTF